MQKRQIHWALILPGIMSFIFLLLALMFRIARAAQGDNVSAALLEVALPIVIGLSLVIVPVSVIIIYGDNRYKRAMAELKSQYPYVYYTRDFRHGPRILAADGQVVSIWRARRKRLEQEASWKRGAVTIKQAPVPVSRAADVPGIVFTDPHSKVRRMAVSDKVTARLQPIDYNAYLPFIQ